MLMPQILPLRILCKSDVHGYEAKINKARTRLDSGRIFRRKSLSRIARDWSPSTDFPERRRHRQPDLALDPGKQRESGL